MNKKQEKPVPFLERLNMKGRGYKATNLNMQCLGYQFVLGQWHEYDGEVELCKQGFHFCLNKDGIDNYYPDKHDRRIWEVEVEGAVIGEFCGVKTKLVAKRIRFIKELPNDAFIDYEEFLSGFTSGTSNIGKYNIGNYNCGSRNSGSRNIGNYNHGHGNVSNGAMRYGCSKPQTVMCFDVDTGLSQQEFDEQADHNVYMILQLLDRSDLTEEYVTKLATSFPVPNVAGEHLLVYYKNRDIKVKEFLKNNFHMS